MPVTLLITTCVRLDIIQLIFIPHSYGRSGPRPGASSSCRLQSRSRTGPCCSPGFSGPYSSPLPPVGPTGLVLQARYASDP